MKNWGGIAFAVALLVALAAIVLAWGARACAQGLGTAADDYDPFYPVGCGSNANPNASGCASYGTSLYSFLAGEHAIEATEYQEANFVVPPGAYPWAGVPSSTCLGAPVAGLTHQPGSCYAYNQNLRAVENNSITYPNNSLCWVAMDENRAGSNAGLPNFARVPNSHYLLDCTDAFAPVMPLDAQLLMQVRTLNGSIIQVVDLRNFSPFTPPLNGSNAIVHSITCAGQPCAISGFNINGIYNIQSYGAVSSTVAPTCTATAGSAAISCTGTGDFQVGQPITLRHAGATMTVVAPVDTVTASKWNSYVNADTPDTAGGFPGNYIIGAVDGLGGVHMGSLVTILNSESPLSFSLFNKNAFTPSGAPLGGNPGTVICGCVGTSCTPALLAIVPQNQNFYWDMGVNTAGTQFGRTPDIGTICTPGAIFNDHDNDTVAAVSNGLPTLLTHPVTNSVTSQILFHDNSVPINQAMALACPNGGTVYAPAGTYTIGQTVEWNNCRGVRFEGAGSSIGNNIAGAGGTTLEWWGALGGWAYEVYCVADSGFSDFVIDDANGTTPSYGLILSNVGCTLTNDTNLYIDHVTVGESGYGTFIANNVNNSPLSFRNLKFVNGGIANLALANAQSKNNTFIGMQEARRLFGTYCITCGDLTFIDKQGNGWIMDWIGTSMNLQEFGDDNELSARYLVTAGPSGAAGTMAFYGSHLQIAPSILQPDGIVFSDLFASPLILDGLNFIGGGGLPMTNFGILAQRTLSMQGSPAVISRGNAYPNLTPFQYIASGNSVISEGDTGSTGSNNQLLPRLVGTPSYYTGTTGAYALPACSALYARNFYCVTDETSACTQSNTYAPGGTNKCQVECNNAGTNWIVTGALCF